MSTNVVTDGTCIFAAGISLLDVLNKLIHDCMLPELFPCCDLSQYAFVFQKDHQSLHIVNAFALLAKLQVVSQWEGCVVGGTLPDITMLLTSPTVHLSHIHIW